MPAASHVALLIDTSTSWGCDLIHGILAYTRRNTNWVVHFEPRGKYEVIAPPAGRKVQGLIARVTTARLAEFIGGLGLPTVNVSWYRHDSLADSIIHCTTDVRRAGQLCAAHFLERGFRHFAYCGAVHRPHYVDELEQSFRATVRRAGHDCDVFVSRVQWHQEGWQIEFSDLHDWLTSLPKPVGLLAFDAMRGHQITEVCRCVGLAVPGAVAVLAGEHDDLYCETSTPPLSSLDIAPRRVGYRAAELLHQILRGLPREQHPESIPPGDITTRLSTDTLAVDDPALATAIRFIHDHAGESIQVKDVLCTVPMSRRVLEQKFRLAIGRTPAAEIRRRKIELAKRLLEESQLPLSTIARRTGFQYAEVLTRMFQRETGMSPSAYRNGIQLRLGRADSHADQQ